MDGWMDDSNVVGVVDIRHSFIWLWGIAVLQMDVGIGILCCGLAAMQARFTAGQSFLVANSVEFYPQELRRMQPPDLDLSQLG